MKFLKCISFLTLLLFAFSAKLQAQCVDSSLIDTSIACPSVYDPVCGCDSVTYNNSCEAINHYGVLWYRAGECSHSSCVDYSVIDSSQYCPDVEPVCGCDSVTYRNSCDAKFYNGVLSWYDGPCLSTAIKDLEKDGVLIYPSTFVNILHVQTNDNFALQIYNTQGKLLYQNELLLGNNSLMLNGFSLGLYYLSLSNKNGQQTYKVVKVE